MRRTTFERLKVILKKFKAFFSKNTNKTQQISFSNNIKKFSKAGK